MSETFVRVNTKDGYVCPRFFSVANENRNYLLYLLIIPLECEGLRLQQLEEDPEICLLDVPGFVKGKNTIYGFYTYVVNRNRQTWKSHI